MNTALPEPFTWTAKVIHGEKVGRTLGFPTVNLDPVPSEKELPGGVYFGTCEIIADTEHPAQTHYCISYFGPRFIFGELTNSFEANLYNFTGDLYETELKITLTHFVRPPMKFDSLETLKNQLEKDKTAGAEILKNVDLEKI